MRQRDRLSTFSADAAHAEDGATVTATVLIPSYRRPDRLRNCLDSVIAGSTVPEQIVVVLRDSDRESHEAVRNWAEENDPGGSLLQIAGVDEPGPMAAANAGLKLAVGDIVCFTDDDCVVAPDWLGRIISRYRDPRVVGVGGRDIVRHGDSIEATPQPAVGLLTWFGRIIGNHHQPDFHEAREVDHLKGANMSFRRRAIPVYDLNLRSGVYHEIDVSLGATAAGGMIVYDPLATVDHFPAPRHYGHERDSQQEQAVTDIAHDCTYVMLKNLRGARRAGFWLFSLALGQHQRYGLLRMLAMLPREGMVAVRRWRAAMRGLFEGHRTVQRVTRAGGAARDDR
jgi:glycosyltransferase involved in cell wall biosynthesis